MNGYAQANWMGMGKVPRLFVQLLGLVINNVLLFSHALAQLNSVS